MLLAVLWAKSLVRKGDPATRFIMASDDKIAHSIICEHTRRVATHDNAKPTADRKRKHNDFSSERRIKEFNRSRRLLLANALRLRRKIKSLPEDTTE